ATERVSSTQERIDEAYALAPVFLSEAARCFSRTEDRVGGLATPPGVLPSDLVRLLRFIDNHLSDPIGLSELAQFSGLSRSNVGRLFRRYLKTTPVEWITRHKIAAAKRLLATGTTPIGQVGVRVGILDPFYFSKLFRKETGLTAKAYRRAASLV
ncbi:MAG TPA: AraC family transcriptional regulator, partial [Planctomycetota bacterium]|nr:AraC family transcriptional regulator [Planctomycetota bacterium]